MKNKQGSQMIKLIISVAIGTMVCKFLESTTLNVWISRIVGQVLTVLLYLYLSEKK